MELLTIQHEDFELSIECAKFETVWEKARNNVGEEALMSTYSWSDGVQSVMMSGGAGEDYLIEKNVPAQSVFFENTDYPIWVDFKDYVKEARFCSTLESDNERFTFHRHILAGYLNYGNEIGRSEIKLVYKVGNEIRRFSFSFEVLSYKLDYHKHWKAIVEDIEKEYRMLSLDYMRRTFHGFAPDKNGETPEIIWWSIFADEQQKFIKACKNIIERPRHRLHGRKTYLRADQLTFIPTSIENEVAEHRRNLAHLYCVEEQETTNDTQENRFLKFALLQISVKYEQLKKQIEKLKGVSEVMRLDMQTVAMSLKRLNRHPFFRTVGRFKGFTQESLVLQKASGYSQVYRTWNILRRAYSLNDGMYRLQTKDIATLYEIWCFIEVSHIVKEQLHLADEDLEHRNRMEMNGLFTWKLGKGEHSRILFKKDDVELAELVYNLKSTETDGSSVGIKELVVPTVPQKPDIVLRLTKNDLQEGMKFTYLFDAKYRIDGKVNGVDVPPDEAINQMHRYRDAIYYKDYSSDALKKEVIGGYILFPGDGTSVDVEMSRFYKSIEKVNIGAFPLRPRDEENRMLLEHFIEGLINTKSQEVIARVIPQKGTFVEVGNRVLIGYVVEGRAGYTDRFENGTATLYYTGRQFPTTIALQDLHFFIPYIKEKGIRDVYEIIRIRTITAQEAKRTEYDDVSVNDLRLAFELRFSRKLFDDYQKVNTHKMILHTFIDTTFDELDGLRIDKNK
ncbi:restriction endonuclease-like protein [Phocaeicola plebeius]|uniref:restriction endonuclease-like protein n=1 Tax=Phocaeicola plebeius TaxID=310297 RepID=UPI0021ACBA26|nr:restriction endonuclease-like protein [Phocaeicola plebeius]MCR8883836.1 restriction endonuclease-like protein [Phocaeicola plebeius]MDM8286932.1 restriction endonuclease-like protein [Phocaeicola plebeius]